MLVLNGVNEWNEIYIFISLIFWIMMARKSRPKLIFFQTELEFITLYHIITRWSALPFVTALSAFKAKLNFGIELGCIVTRA